MNIPENISRRFSAQPLTRARMAVAIGVAVAADGLQWVLGPFGWLGADEVIDLVAMALTTLALGFHPLLLPTFVMEFIPILDMLPTWTGCVIAVIALRKRAQRGAVPPQIPTVEPPKPKDTPVIDI